MTSLAIVPTSRPRHRRSPDVGALVADLRRQHGKRASAALCDLILENEAVARAIADFVVEKLTAAAPRRRPQPSAKARADHVASERVAVEKLVSHVKVTVLDMIMPNGERLRFCRGSDCAQWGAGLARIAEKVGPDCLVGEVLCEKDAAALLMGAS